MKYGYPRLPFHPDHQKTPEPWSSGPPGYLAPLDIWPPWISGPPGHPAPLDQCTTPSQPPFHLPNRLPSGANIDSSHTLCTDQIGGQGAAHSPLSGARLVDKSPPLCCRGRPRCGAMPPGSPTPRLPLQGAAHSVPLTRHCPLGGGQGSSTPRQKEWR